MLHRRKNNCTNNWRIKSTTFRIHYYSIDVHSDKRFLTILRCTQTWIILWISGGSILSLVRFYMLWEGSIKGWLWKHSISIIYHNTILSCNIEECATSSHRIPPQTAEAVCFHKGANRLQFQLTKPEATQITVVGLTFKNTYQKPYWMRESRIIWKAPFVLSSNV